MFFNVSRSLAGVVGEVIVWCTVRIFPPPFFQFHFLFKKGPDEPNQLLLGGRDTGQVAQVRVEGPAQGR